MGKKRRYITGLDGIRAIAVIMVLAYHLKLALFKSGFLGVTVFFVLSGYLITGILISEVEEEGTIDLKNFWLRRIEIGYLIFLFVTIPCGMVFSVSADNIYSRGPHFYIYIVMYFGAILYLSASTVITAREFQNRSRLLIYPLILFVMAETIIQVALPELHVTWLCVTLLSVLYFIYCSEMWNQLDALTGLLNQNSYLKQTGGVRCKGGVLVVFDVDDFKQINDRYGHIQGDRCLAGIAECIKKSYANFGYCYRIGGDEFCVLLKNGGNEGRCKQEFLQRLQEKRGEIAFLPTVSYGSAPFSGEDIVKVKDRADQDMYQYKKERKNRKRLS